MTETARGLARVRAAAAIRRRRSSSPASASTRAASRSPLRPASGNTSAAPRSASTSAFACWCPSAAPGRGTSSDGRPDAASSERVVAPARLTTTSARRMMSAISWKNGATRAGTPARTYASCTGP